MLKTRLVEAGFVIGCTVILVVLFYPQYLPFFQGRFDGFHNEIGFPLHSNISMTGVYVFANVCIESLDVPKLQNRDRELFNETKKIVVYGRHHRTPGSVNVGVAGSVNSLWNHWDLHFTDRTLPEESRIHSGNTAFFIQPTCPGNFHHFFVDEFLPLYSVIAASNRLHPDSGNHVIYRTPQNSKNRCSDRNTYEDFLWTLYVNRLHDVFYNLPANTCFRHAIFGSKPVLSRPRDVIDHVLRFYGLTSSSSDARVNASDLYVTILSRQDRRILNPKELVEFVGNAGFRKIRIVDFGAVSVRDQLRIMSTTGVFVGVEGAGLQWAVFMPKGSYLVELAWPGKHWGFYYDSFVPSFGIVWRGVGVDDVRINWTSYERNVRGGVPMKSEEKEELKRTHPRDTSDNIWKWSDIRVQKKDIAETLNIVYKALATT